MDSSPTPSPPTILEFFRLVFAHWLEGCSGGLSVPFAVLAAWRQDVAERLIFAALAVLALLLATFSVWRKERNRCIDAAQQLRNALDDQDERSTRPYIIIEGARHAKPGNGLYGNRLPNEFYLLIRNAGKSPARTTLIFFSTHFGRELSRDYERTERAEFGDIGPDKDREFYHRLVSSVEGEHQEYLQNKLDLFLYGRVCYRGFEGSQYEQPYAFRYDQSQGRFVVCNSDDH